MRAKVMNLLGLVLVAAVLAVGCAPATPTSTPAKEAPLPTPTSPPAREAEPIKLGLLMHLSGQGAFIGQLAQDGVNLAHQLRPTVLGRPVEIVVCDDRSDKAEGVACMSRLIEHDKAVAVVGSLFSSICIAAGEINEQAKIPACSPMSTNPLTTKDRDYYFRPVALDDDMGSAGAKYAIDNLKASTAALLYEVTNEANVAEAVAFREAWEGLGKDPSTIVADLTYRGGDEDFTAQATIISQKNPDVLFMAGQAPPAILMAQQLHALGVYPTFIGTDAWDVAELTDLGGEDVEGFAFTTHYDPQMVDTPESRAFLAAMQDEYGRVPGGPEATGFDCYNMLVTAIEEAGSTDGEAIQRELEAFVDFPGVTGAITPGSSHNPKKALALLVVRDGKREYVLTVPPRP